MVWVGVFREFFPLGASHFFPFITGGLLVRDVFIGG
jgi:hypothetical protein